MQTVNDTDPRSGMPTTVTLANGQTQSQTLNARLAFGTGTCYSDPSPDSAKSRRL